MDVFPDPETRSMKASAEPAQASIPFWLYVGMPVSIQDKLKSFDEGNDIDITTTA